MGDADRGAWADHVERLLRIAEGLDRVDGLAVDDGLRALALRAVDPRQHAERLEHEQPRLRARDGDEPVLAVDRVDRGARRQAIAQQSGAERLCGRGVAVEQEDVVGQAQRAQVGDDAGLRRQEQGVGGAADLQPGQVGADDALQELEGARSGDTGERARRAAVGDADGAADGAVACRDRVLDGDGSVHADSLRSPCESPAGIARRDSGIEPSPFRSGLRVSRHPRR